ncbi:MAG: hypothetical protein NBV68_17130 [Erythrobacter sp.]|uniref:hypothetical protein n=1 Tax=Erythrobacter sp. TaxID=1042 RepID=UPI0025FC42C1|nr:hypothetical protein [Erythrobacter sp.]MCM0001099.1 hypothetical protein [Erythrobacter sp.]
MIEYRSSIAEKQRALRWQQAETAREIIEALRGNLHASAALKMLDWTGITYRKPDGTATAQITTAQRRFMLRIEGAIFDPEAERDAEFVRDCFDRLFEDCCLIEAYIASGLVKAEDLTAYFCHYMKLAAAPDEAVVLDRFARAYGYKAFFGFRDRMRRAGQA